MYLGGLVSALVLVAGGVAALLVPVAAVLFVLGRGGEAGRALLWAVVLAFVSVSGWGVVSWLLGGGVGGGAPGGFVVMGPPAYASKYFPVEVTVVPTGSGRIVYRVSVWWGDGSVDTASAQAPEPVRVSHAYRGVGNYSVVVAVYVEGGSLSEEVAGGEYVVRVSAPWGEIAGVAEEVGGEISEEGSFWEKPIRWLLKHALIYGGEVFERAVDLASRLMAEVGLYPGYALYYYVSMPSPGNFPAMRDVYGRMARWALLLLPLAFTVNLVWRAFWEFERPLPLLDSARELVWAVFAVLLGLEVYGAAADLANTVSLSVAQLGNVSAVYAMVLGLTAVLGAFSFVSGYAGLLAAMSAGSLVLLVFGGLLKWLLAAALAVSIPILAVVWLVPPLRPAASGAASLLTGLFVFTLVASGFTALAGEMAASLTQAQGGLANLVFAIALPLVYMGAGPLLMQSLGIHAGGLFLPRLRGLGGLVIGPRPAAAATAAATGIAAAALAPAALGTPIRGETRLTNPVAHAIAGAPATLAPAQTPAIREVRHPRLHAASTLITAAARGEKIEGLTRREKMAYATARIPAYFARSAAEFARGFKAGLERELGIRLPGGAALGRFGGAAGKVLKKGFGHVRDVATGRSSLRTRGAW